MGYGAFLGQPILGVVCGGLGVVVHVDVPQHGRLDVRAGEDDRRTRPLLDTRAGEDDAADASADADGGDRAMEDERMRTATSSRHVAIVGGDPRPALEDAPAPRQSLDACVRARGFRKARAGFCFGPSVSVGTISQDVLSEDDAIFEAPGGVGQEGLGERSLIRPAMASAGARFLKGQVEAIFNIGGLGQ